MHQTIVDNVIIEKLEISVSLISTVTSKYDRKGFLEIVKDYVVLYLRTLLKFKIKPMHCCIGEIK